ncbi:ExbD/TolR family protein [Halioxenophilus sp. WMMB6]|uniref:ExbD/TolR family protein n=1 Tax=Halioxenophilus sp. WMMB6 TaxID=3073815 RepID=UPI00295F3452|nr:biopolymer transporter ExbD [Halioxenophilus sp. WMMB6]
MFLNRRKHAHEAELDITSFMNLMIILVPVLLMSMVFSHVTVLDLTLPDAGAGAAADSEQPKILEVIINSDYLDVNYPAGIRVKRIEKVASEEAPSEMVYNFDLLSLTLQEIKRQLKEKGIDKRDILILSQKTTDYQTLVSTMDTVRSFKTVLVSDVVDAELFPAISLGDAPVTSAGGQ